KVVVHHLEVPYQPACRGLQCHQLVREQVLTLAITAIKIIRRRTDRQKDQTALRAHTHSRPHVGACSSLPRLFCPSLVSCFSRSGYRMECPHQLPGANIECAYCPAWSFGGI